MDVIATPIDGGTINVAGTANSTAVTPPAQTRALGAILVVTAFVPVLGGGSGTPLDAHVQSRVSGSTSWYVCGGSGVRFNANGTFYIEVVDPILDDVRLQVTRQLANGSTATVAITWLADQVNFGHNNSATLPHCTVRSTVRAAALAPATVTTANVTIGDPSTTGLVAIITVAGRTAGNVAIATQGSTDGGTTFVALADADGNALGTGALTTNGDNYTPISNGRLIPSIIRFLITVAGGFDGSVGIVLASTSGLDAAVGDPSGTRRTASGLPVNALPFGPMTGQVPRVADIGAAFFKSAEITVQGGGAVVLTNHNLGRTPGLAFCVPTALTAALPNAYIVDVTATSDTQIQTTEVSGNVTDKYRIIAV